jgi:hypothetical protein
MMPPFEALVLLGLMDASMVYGELPVGSGAVPPMVE